MAEKSEEREREGEGGEGKLYRVFVYGTLKKGFGNDWLTEQMIEEGHAELVGMARSKEAYPLVCGPYSVPFLLPFPRSGHRVLGELYALNRHALALFDHLEGTSNAHYARRPIQIQIIRHSADTENENEVESDAEAYFAGDGYAHQLWSKTGVERCLTSYSHQHSKAYVTRSNRPPHLTFLQHIHIFLSTPTPTLAPAPAPAPSHQHGAQLTHTAISHPQPFS